MAKPSKPSVKFTPLLVPRTIKITQIITSTIPSFIEVSLTVDRFIEIGVNPFLSGNCNPAYANDPATIACPNSFCFAFKPIDFCLATFNQSSKKPTKPNPIISAITRSAEVVAGTPVSK